MELPKLEKMHDLSDFCSVQKSRYAITGQHFNAKYSCMEATDGRIAIRVPIKSIERTSAEFSEPAKDCILPCDAVKGALKAIDKLGVSHLSQSGENAVIKVENSNGVSEFKARPLEATYPNFDMVIPDYETNEKRIKISFNPELLLTLCQWAVKHGSKTLDASGKRSTLTLEFVDEFSAAKATIPTDNGPAIAVVMPCRLS